MQPFINILACLLVVVVGDVVQVGAARPDLNSSSFTATAGGGLRIGVEYGADDEFILVEGKLGKCDAAGYAAGRAKLSGAIGNCSLVDFDVDVSYRCDVSSDPRWIPQTTITGIKKRSGSSSYPYVFGYELADFEITIAGYARSLTSWVFAGSVKGTTVAKDGGGGAKMEWVFDTRQSRWDEAVTNEYETANLKATLAHAKSSVCTSAGQFVDGFMSVNLTGSGGGAAFKTVTTLKGPTSGARRCGSDLAHLGRYSLSMEAADTSVALSDTLTLSLTKTRLNAKGNNPAGMERSLDFGILEWQGFKKVFFDFYF